MTEPLVSVILPTRNRAGIVSRAVRSVLAQSYRNLELIVVDDASTDPTLEQLAAIDDPRLRILRNSTRLGPSGARNHGLGNSGGELVAFIDSDDEWRIERLARSVAVFGEDAAIVAVACGCFCPQDARASFFSAMPAARSVDLAPRVPMRVPGTSSWTMRRWALDAVGAFDVDVTRFEEWELALRLLGVGAVRFVGEPLVIYERSADSLLADDSAYAGNLERILGRHAELLKRHPRAYSAYCNLAGQSYCKSGDARRGRYWLRQALASRPLQLRAWANLAVSLLGRRVFARYVAAGRRLRSERSRASSA